MTKRSKWILGVLVLTSGLLQLTNPARTNPPVVVDMIATNTPPPKVAALLHAACYDCHSNETRWPWYSRMVPVSWLIASDVNEGRHHLNLSEWPASDPDRASDKLDRMSEVLGYHEMPPKKYSLIHVDARLTDAERKELTDWLDSESEKVRHRGQ